MALEDLVGPDKYLDALVPANPTGTDPKEQGDDHIRGVKNALQNTFPKLDGPVDFDAADMSKGIQGGLTGSMPVGAIMDFPFVEAALDPGWLPCNGQAIDRTVYANLFAKMGIAYGGGDGSTTFNLPDLRGRARQHAGQGLTLEGDQAGTTWAIADAGGYEDHAQTEAELAQHSHFLNANQVVQAGDNANRGDGYIGADSYETSQAGSGQAAPILGPRLTFTSAIWTGVTE